MITIEIPEVQLVNSTTDENIEIDSNTAGVIAQHLANAVIAGLKNGPGFTIRERSAEVQITTARVVKNDVTETYVGQ